MTDIILDVNHRRIYAGLQVAGSGGDGSVAGFVSSEEREGQNPCVLVLWPEYEAPESLNTGVRDLRKEGPDGPYTYVCPDLEVIDPPLPDRLKDRPWAKGMLVPYIADSTDRAQGAEGGIVVFGKSDPVRWAECVEERRCAMCGDRLAYWIAFIGGPRSIRSRAFLDPAMHIECAEYAMAVCPWMLSGKDFGSAERTLPKPPRGREQTKIEDSNEDRIGLYITRSYRVRHETVQIKKAPQVIVYCYAAQMKRVQWMKRLE